MQSFLEFFTEQTSQTININDWRNKAVSGFKEISDIHSLEEVASEQEQPKLATELNNAINRLCVHMKSISEVAFNKYQRFHELEYKLHLLETEYNRDEVQNLIDFTKHEILKLYPWLEAVIRTVLETRLAMFNEEKWKERAKRFEKIIQTDEDVFKRTWDNIYASYALLNTAKTLSDKIKAITVSLNAAHDSSKLFINTPDYANRVKVPDYRYHSNDHGWCFGPFTIEQYNKLNYVDTNRVKREIKKEIG